MNCVACALAPRSAATSGSAGRYMSIANGPDRAKQADHQRDAHHSGLRRHEDTLPSGAVADRATWRAARLSTSGGPVNPAAALQ